MKAEWWYESSLYDVDNTLVFAKLTVRDDGRAEILSDAGDTLPFANEDEAAAWLSDEEYYPFDHLLERLESENTPPDPRIKAPVERPGVELLPQMVVPLATPVETPMPSPAPPVVAARAPAP